jgi:site-specific DNA-methyltransferase (adenine-specific)
MITDEYIKSKMNTIINADCLEVMKQVPDNYFDLVLTDPPYGIGMDNELYKAGENNSKNGFIKHKRTNWDNATPTKEIFDEIFRISKNQIIWGGNYFATMMSHNSQGWLYWNKGQEGFSFADGELAWTSFDKAVRAFRMTRVEGAKEKGLHPTQKPMKVIEWSLQQAKAEKHFKIFDPFMGSGTTAVACQSLGLEWCGCELEADYVAIANKRLEAVQGSLF